VFFIRIVYKDVNNLKWFWHFGWNFPYFLSLSFNKYDIIFIFNMYFIFQTFTFFNLKKIHSFYKLLQLMYILCLVMLKGLQWSYRTAFIRNKWIVIIYLYFRFYFILQNKAYRHSTCSIELLIWYNVELKSICCRHIEHYFFIVDFYKSHHCRFGLSTFYTTKWYNNEISSQSDVLYTNPYTDLWVISSYDWDIMMFVIGLIVNFK